ncbi:MAG: RHS repeat domain-containing protein [Terriglobales bacterium]
MSAAAGAGELTAGGWGGYTLSGVTHAPDGDVLAANDSVNGQWQYEYGPLNRLLDACDPNCSSPATALQYVYDRFGNRWEENALAGGGPSPQLTFDDNNHIVGGSYDASGDLLAEGSNTFTYDAEGRIASATVGGGDVQYVYDAFGHRVEKITPAGTFYYLHDLSGRPITELSSTGGFNRGEVYASGRHMATYANNTTYFDYSDWLGTERMRATVAGYEQDQCTSLPYGADLNCTGGTDYSPMHFTGQVRDAATGLDHFPARNYTSAWGIWTTPDRSGKATALSNPQSWDLYVYCLDDPLTLLDPDGKAPIPPLVLWRLQHFSSYVQQRSAVLAADYAADRPMIMTASMGEALDATLRSGGPPSEFADAGNAHNEGAFQRLADLEAPAAGSVLKAQVVKWMNAKTTSVGDLEKALAALRATQAIAAKTGEAGKALSKIGGTPGLGRIGTFLKIGGGLLQFGGGQEKREYGYKLLGTLIPLIDKKIEEKEHQPGDCMMMLKSCKQ